MNYNEDDRIQKKEGRKVGRMEGRKEGKAGQVSRLGQIQGEGK